jgi:hypothetical protein
MPGMPSGLWDYELIAYLLQRLNKNDNKLRADRFQDKNAHKLPSLQEPSDGRLANFVRLWASLPRTTKDETAYHCTPIIDGKKKSRTLKCYSRWSWARDPENSKSKPMVQARECQADGEPSLDVSRDHVRALTRQKQLVELRQAASQPASQRLPFLVGTAIPQRRLKIFRWEREMGPRETTRKNEILFYRTSTYVVGNMPSMDVLRNESKRIILLIIWNAIGQEILANFVVK